MISGKSERRVLHNAQKVTQGPSAALDFDDPKTGDIICNNAEWHTHMSVVTSWAGAVQLRRGFVWIFRMNAVLQRDSVKKRLKTDQGTASDQWGNFVLGIELVRKSTDEVRSTGEAGGVWSNVGTADDGYAGNYMVGAKHGVYGDMGEDEDVDKFGTNEHMA
uniref:Uncharacterized protein n=1 Tax=Phytophthora ramorum TaxID=164328 RepID=H3GMR7_PHYRM